jgi:hypothetical protein
MFLLKNVLNYAIFRLKINNIPKPYRSEENDLKFYPFTQFSFLMTKKEKNICIFCVQRLITDEKSNVTKLTIPNPT